LEKDRGNVVKNILGGDGPSRNHLYTRGTDLAKNEERKKTFRTLNPTQRIATYNTLKGAVHQWGENNRNRIGFTKALIWNGKGGALKNYLMLKERSIFYW